MLLHVFTYDCGYCILHREEAEIATRRYHFERVPYCGREESKTYIGRGATEATCSPRVQQEGSTGVTAAKESPRGRVTAECDILYQGQRQFESKE